MKKREFISLAASSSAALICSSCDDRNSRLSAHVRSFSKEEVVTAALVLFGLTAIGRFAQLFQTFCVSTAAGYASRYLFEQYNTPRPLERQRLSEADLILSPNEPKIYGSVSDRDEFLKSEAVAASFVIDHPEDGLTTRITHGPHDGYRIPYVIKGGKEVPLATSHIAVLDDFVRQHPRHKDDGLPENYGQRMRQRLLPGITSNNRFWALLDKSDGKLITTDYSVPAGRLLISQYISNLDAYILNLDLRNDLRGKVPEIRNFRGEVPHGNHIYMGRK